MIEVTITTPWIFGGTTTGPMEIERLTGRWKLKEDGIMAIEYSRFGALFWISESNICFDFVI